LKIIPFEFKGNGHKGIHSLHSVNPDTIVIGSLDYSRFLNWNGESSGVEIPEISHCSSISFDHKNSQMLCVVRKHALENSYFIFRFDQESDAPQLINSFTTKEKNRTVLARSCINGSLVCTPDELSKQAVLYDSGNVIYSLEPHPSYILDVSLCPSGNMFACASSSRLDLYSQKVN
jgi:WD40 repeat protein